jgi:phage-related protein
LGSNVVFIIISGVGLSPLVTAATSGLLYKPQMIDEGDCGAIGEWELAGETEVLGENLPRATSSATNPTWPELVPNLGRRGGKPMTNRLSYDTTHRSKDKCSCVDDKRAEICLWNTYNSH